MAIDDKLIRRDFGGMGCIAVGEDDERVLRGRWVYYAMADRWGLGARRPRSGVNPTDLGDVMVAAALGLLRWLCEAVRPRPWKVAVYRMGNIGVFNESGMRRIHLETLPLGVEPQVRIAELVAQAEAGAFDPDA